MSFLVVTLITGCSTESLYPIPILVSVVGGTEQEAPFGETLPQPIKVKVEDTQGVPIEGASIGWAPMDGGSITSSSATTDGSGTAQATWTLGPSQGQQSLIVEVSDEEVIVEAFATPPTPEAWADVLDFTVTTSVAGDTLIAAVAIQSSWAGTVRLLASSSCLLIPRLYDQDGAIASTFGCCVCWARPTNFSIPPNGRLEREFRTDAAVLVAGEYLVRVQADAGTINGGPPHFRMQ